MIIPVTSLVLISACPPYAYAWLYRKKCTTAQLRWLSDSWNSETEKRQKRQLWVTMPIMQWEEEMTKQPGTNKTLKYATTLTSPCYGYYGYPTFCRDTWCFQGYIFFKVYFYSKERLSILVKTFSWGSCNEH